jgi:hypothetical protein
MSFHGTSQKRHSAPRIYNSDTLTKQLHSTHLFSWAAASSFVSARIFLLTASIQCSASFLRV